jgi:acetolactate synthase-1/2/3 large subunit
VIHLDIVAEEMGRTYEPTVKLWGDAKAGLEDLHAAARRPRGRRAEGWPRAYLADIPKRMEAWRDETVEKRLSDETPVHMGRLITELNRLLPEDGYLIADGGFAAHWGGLLFDTKRAQAGISCPTGALPPSDTVCPAPWARNWPPQRRRSWA